MLIKSQEANQKIVGPMVVKEYKINPDFSAALIEIDGDHGKLKCIGEDRIYFILEGKGKCLIGDKEYDIAPNDLFFVPRNTVYNIIGKLKHFVVCSPEFNPKDDVFLGD